jgi:hypothetical protein
MQQVYIYLHSHFLSEIELTGPVIYAWIVWSCRWIGKILEKALFLPLWKEQLPKCRVDLSQEAQRTFLECSRPKEVENWQR